LYSKLLWMTGMLKARTLTRTARILSVREPLLCYHGKKT